MIVGLGLGLVPFEEPEPPVVDGRTVVLPLPLVEALDALEAREVVELTPDEVVAPDEDELGRVVLEEPPLPPPAVVVAAVVVDVGAGGAPLVVVVVVVGGTDVVVVDVAAGGPPLVVVDR